MVWRMVRLGLLGRLAKIEHALRESLSTGIGAEIGGETKGLVDGQESFDNEHGCSGNLSFFEDMSTTTIEDTVDSTNSDFGTLDFTQVDGFHETRLGCDVRSVENTTSCWNDLAASAMDCVSVESHVINVEANGWKETYLNKYFSE
jgi:hypothetical protein